MSRRFVPLAVIMVGGLAGAAGGWVLGSLMFAGGSLNLEWWLAVCCAPIGMWLGWLGGASRSRVAVSAALGGTVGALLGALASPILFNRDGPPANNEIWALAGLLGGAIFGSLFGALIGRSVASTSSSDDQQ
jgi:hypothetical protein